MRIGIISDFFPLYGAKAVFKLVRMMEHEGHSAVILSSNSLQTGARIQSGTERFMHNSILIRMKSEIRNLESSPIVIPPSLPLLANGIFEKHSVDLVHVHFLASYSFQVYCFLSTIAKRFPIVATPHGVVDGYKTLGMRGLASLIRSFSRLSLRAVDRFTAVSRLSMNFLQDLGEFPSGYICSQRG